MPKSGERRDFLLVRSLRFALRPPLSLSLDTANSAKMGRFDWGTTPNEREGALRVEGLECRFGDIICVKIAPTFLSVVGRNQVGCKQKFNQTYLNYFQV